MFPHPKFHGLTNPTPPQIHLIHTVGYAIEEYERYHFSYQRDQV